MKAVALLLIAFAFGMMPLTAIALWRGIPEHVVIYVMPSAVMPAACPPLKWDT